MPARRESEVKPTVFSQSFHELRLGQAHELLVQGFLLLVDHMVFRGPMLGRSLIQILDRRNILGVGAVERLLDRVRRDVLSLGQRRPHQGRTDSHENRVNVRPTHGITLK
jgi:hypothetical protein